MVLVPPPEFLATQIFYGIAGLVVVFDLVGGLELAIETVVIPTLKREI
ncbi:MAG: hypothetical protein QNJ74_16205 [Trichodesmium sp. MO_231.B1]|nr:hypothetical protein [Trichodesmium sp. MO_231.B1]